MFKRQKKSKPHAPNRHLQDQILEANCFKTVGAKKASNTLQIDTFRTRLDPDTISVLLQNTKKKTQAKRSKSTPSGPDTRGKLRQNSGRKKGKQHAPNGHLEAQILEVNCVQQVGAKKGSKTNKLDPSGPDSKGKLRPTAGRKNTNSTPSGPDTRGKLHQTSGCKKASKTHGLDPFRTRL